jgi:hypothetical protein
VIKRCSMADSATDIVLDLIKGSWLAHNMVLKPSIWNWKLSFFYQNPSEKDIYSCTPCRMFAV